MPTYSGVWTLPAQMQAQAQGLWPVVLDNRALFGGGNNGDYTNVISYVDISSTGNATDFGDLTITLQGLGSCSSVSRGIFGGGTGGSPAADRNVINYVTIATTGNASSFGELSARYADVKACSSSTRGVFGGGYV